MTSRSTLQANTLLLIALLMSTACVSSLSSKDKNSTTRHAASANSTSASFTDIVVKETPNKPRAVIVVEPMRIEVVRDDEGNQQVITTDARAIFDEANDALQRDDAARALELYDELLADFAESSLTAPAQFNAGLALEALDRVDDALARYQTLGEDLRAGRDGVDARIRAAALLAENRRWSEALAVLAALLERKDLAVSDRVEAMARSGYVLLEAKDYKAAETTLQESIEVYKRALAQAGLDSDYFQAMALFYLADIPRRQFDLIPVRLPETQMERDIEAKATLVLLASDRFADTIEFGNAYWSTAAGFRLADMQHSFWKSLVSAPIPPHLSEQASKIYVREVHGAALSLLQKALSIHGKNLKLAKLYKNETHWSTASAAMVVELTQLVGQEQAGDFTGPKRSRGPWRDGQGAGPYFPGRVEL